MSQENVEIVRRAWDFEGDALKDFDPEVVWNPIEGPAPLYGLDAAVRAYNEWKATWENLEETAEEFIDAGDRVVVSNHYRGRGAASGIEVEARTHEVYTLRDGKIVGVDEFPTRDEALKAAGLRE